MVEGKGFKKYGVEVTFNGILEKGEKGKGKMY
jgi:hypothetical protein